MPAPDLNPTSQAAILDGGAPLVNSDSLALPQLIERAARQSPDAGITYIHADGRRELQTYARLYAGSLGFARGLSQRLGRPWAAQQAAWRAGDPAAGGARSAAAGLP